MVLRATPENYFESVREQPRVVRLQETTQTDYTPLIICVVSIIGIIGVLGVVAYLLKRC